jgi:hypothetical protein
LAFKKIKSSDILKLQRLNFIPDNVPWVLGLFTPQYTAKLLTLNFANIENSRPMGLLI